MKIDTCRYPNRESGSHRTRRLLQTIYPDGKLEPALALPTSAQNQKWERSDAIRELLRGRLEACGPITAETLVELFQLPPTEIDAALLALEAEGFVLRGKFHADAMEQEWCDRRLLARITGSRSIGCARRFTGFNP